jgi:hypothetical protein
MKMSAVIAGGTCGTGSRSRYRIEHGRDTDHYNRDVGNLDWSGGLGDHETRRGWRSMTIYIVFATIVFIIELVRQHRRMDRLEEYTKKLERMILENNEI